MSDRDWRQFYKLFGLTALGLSLCCGLLFGGMWVGWGLGYYGANAEYHSYRYSADTRASIDQCFAKFPATKDDAKDCVAGAIEADRESKRNEEDLSAQKQMADWALALLIVSIIQIPLGIGGFIALLYTIQQSREANGIARTVGQAQVRAYLSVSRVSFEFMPPNRFLGVKVGLKNTGQSPAKFGGLETTTRVFEAGTMIYNHSAHIKTLEHIHAGFDADLTPHGERSTVVWDIFQADPSKFLMAEVQVVLNAEDVFDLPIKEEFRFNGGVFVKEDKIVSSLQQSSPNIDL